MQKMLIAWLAKIWVLAISVATVSISAFILSVFLRMVCEAGKYGWTFGGLLP